MKLKKTDVGAEVSASPKATPLRPYNMRVKRDHGGGLWTIEADDGQLFLAVESREVDAVRRIAAEEARAAGRAYAEPHPSRRRPRRSTAA